MKTSLTIIASLALSALCAPAQEMTRMEAFLGYTYVRVNSATNVPSFGANGGGGQFAYNFNHWVSGVADLGAVHTGHIGNAIVDNTLANFLFGPRFAYRKNKRFTPYGQILVGGVRDTASSALPIQPVLIPGNPVTGRVNAAQTAFAFTLGGGVDLMINKHLSFRPIGLDWYRTRLQNLRSANDNNQNNLRYTTGFTFHFGAR